jgi:PhnB protein
MAQLSPHITFNGNCREAFNFYRNAFGGEFATVMTYGDVPAGENNPGTADPNKIIHMSLPISKETSLMGCDMPAAFGQANVGNNFNISINADSRDEANRLFAALSAGGSVVMPMADTFWGAWFGMCTDPFGIQWMISYDAHQPQP